MRPLRPWPLYWMDWPRGLLSLEGGPARPDPSRPSPRRAVNA